MSKYDVVYFIFIFMGLGFLWLRGRADTRVRKARNAEIERLQRMTSDALQDQFEAVLGRYDDLMRDLNGIQGDLKDAQTQLWSILQTVADLRGQLAEPPASLDRKSRAGTAARAGELHKDLMEVIETITWVGKVTRDSLDKHGQDDELDVIRLAIQRPPATTLTPDPM